MFVPKRIVHTVDKKQVVNTIVSSHIVYKFICSCCNAIYYCQTQRHFFVRASEHLGITPLTGKFVKTLKKPAISNHMLLDGHKASFDNFSIFLKESNPFKLQLKESSLISRDKPILNENINSFPLELFDWLWHCYLIFIVIFIIPCQYIILYKIVITIKLSQFDNASSWSKSLFVINKLWIPRKYFCIFCNINWVDI